MDSSDEIMSESETKEEDISLPMSENVQVIRRRRNYQRVRSEPEFLTSSVMNTDTTSLVTRNQRNLFTTFLEFMETFIEADNISEAMNNSFDTYCNEIFRRNDTIQITIPVKTFSDISHKDDIKCFICLDQFENTDRIYELRCGHVFHCDCLTEAARFQHSNCPLCRTALPVETSDSIVNEAGHHVSITYTGPTGMSVTDIQ